MQIIQITVLLFSLGTTICTLKQTNGWMTEDTIGSHSNDTISIMDYLTAKHLRGLVVSAYVGSVARIPCPGSAIDNQELVWMYTESIHNLTLRPMEEKEMAVEEGNLTIFYVQQADAGVYQCQVGSDVLSLVVLDVQHDEEQYNMLNVSDVTPAEVEVLLDDDESRVLRVFPGGIPCRSHLLPKTIASLPAVYSRKNEIMIGMCRVPCKSNIFELRSVTDQVIERVNNSEGVYSLCQREPPQPPPVSRDIIFAVKGTGVTVKCPGTTLRDIPMSWRVGNKVVTPRQLDVKSGGRVHLNARDHIVISAAEYTDSNVYSCWQERRLAGVMKVSIFEDTCSEYRHRLMLVGLFCCLCVVLRLTVKLYLHSSRRVI